MIDACEIFRACASKAELKAAFARDDVQAELRRLKDLPPKYEYCYVWTMNTYDHYLSKLPAAASTLAPTLANRNYFTPNQQKPQGRLF